MGTVWNNMNHMFSTTTTASYVTGSHTVKFGMHLIHSSDDTDRVATGSTPTG